MNVKAPVSPRVRRVINLILRLAPEEREQLRFLLPPDMTIGVEKMEASVREAVAYICEQAIHRATPPSLGDPFIGELTYREYFALSDEEAEALWEQLSAEAPTADEAPVVEVSPDARIPVQ